MTWDETVKRLEGARLNYVAAVWRGAGFDPEIAEELDDIAAALRLLLAAAVPRADREPAFDTDGEPIQYQGPAIPKAEAPPETGHAAESCGQCECCEAWRATHDEALADVARLTAENAALKAKLDATTDDFGCVPVSFSSVIDGIDSRQTQEAVENLVVWHMRRAEKAEAERDAALATATEAAETVARLTAERDAARAQTWAEAIAVVERMPQASLPDTYSEDPDIISRSEVLAALRAKQKEEPK